MGAKYTTLSTSGYNSSPPPDDGTQTAANLITWDKHKTKLSDPVKTLADAMNTALVSAFDYSVRQISASDSTVAGDHMRCVEIAPTVSAAVTVSLGDAATMTNAYRLFVKNSSTITQTIGRVTVGDKIDNVAANISIGSGEGIVLQVTTGANGYVTIARTGLPLTGGTVSGDVTISKATPILAIDGTGTTSSFLRLTRGGVTKWDVVNAGTTSDQFQITDGSVILVTVNRTTGNSVVTGSVTATGGLVANFTSAETALGGASTTTVAHGLGAVPSHFEIVIRNKITELGYAVGDEVSMATNISAGVLTLWADATNIGMTQTASSITICRRDTFVGAAITVANWKYVVRAWK